MKKITHYILVFITILFINSCCSNYRCEPCMGKPNLIYFGSPILKFDTSNSNYKLTDLDTFYLYKNKFEMPIDTIINYENKTVINGENLRLNNYISDKFKSRIIKIDSLNFVVSKKGVGCCSCDKYEEVSIQVNDSVYPINKLPIVITK